MNTAYPFVPALREPEGSPIRELFKYLSDPQMISFAGGYPSAALFDARASARRRRRCWRSGRPSACSTVPPKARWRCGALTALMAERGATVAPEELLVTTGSQQGLRLLVKAPVEPGSLVLVEEPTYSATLQALRLAGAALRGIPADHEGIDVEALEAVLEAAAAAGERPRLLYVVPTFANPTGATLSLPRRLRLLELVARHRGAGRGRSLRRAEFRRRAAAVAAVAVRAGAGRAAVGGALASLSKTLAPGLRLGWLAGPAEIVRRAVIAKQVSDLCTPPGCS